MKRAKYIAQPQTFIRHTPNRSFIGPGTILLENGDILMAAPWGRPPTNFEQLAAQFPVPMLYRSRDGGRTWQEQGRINMEWKLTAMMSDGGITFLRLQDGRLAMLTHRHVERLKGGGVPVFSTSQDDGATWTPARLLVHEDSIHYVMNDRMIQLRSGRLLVPTCHPDGTYEYEGDAVVARCFISDDLGENWRLSSDAGIARLPGDQRGMAEPCVAEVDGGRLLMVARTGSGCKYASWSEDGGDTWSTPEPTTLVAACSSLTLKTLPDGRLIVFYNHVKPLGAGAFFPRTPLCYAVSSDGGKSWGEPVLVDESGVQLQDRQVIYTSICFTAEGMLVVYSNHMADPDGSFANQYSHESLDCGGVRCILEYPEKC
jgi:hypothetical protein